MKVGDLVEMVPKNYSSNDIKVPDQWKGLTGIIIEELPYCGGYTLLIKHPEDLVPSEILVSRNDCKVLVCS
jgi:hypothetical protein